MALSFSDLDVVERAAALLGTHVTLKIRPAPFKKVYSARIWGDTAVAWIADLFSQLGDRRKAKALEALELYATTRSKKVHYDICKYGHPLIEPSSIYVSGRRSWCKKCRTKGKLPSRVA